MTTSNEMAVELRHDEQTTAVVLWGTNEPSAIVSRMGVVSAALAGVIRDKRMSKRIGEREYVFIEGWTLCGAILGVFPRTSTLEEMRTGDGEMFGFRATVELVTRDGGVVGGAVAICTRDEERWHDREWNQIASMAQTRASAKAYRGSLGFVMQMAGYAPTPAEEMDGIGEQRQSSPFTPRQRAQSAPATSGTLANRGAFLTAMHGEFGMDKKQTLAFLGCTEAEQLDGVMEPFETWDALLVNARETLKELAQAQNAVTA